MGGGLERRCVSRVYDADGAVHSCNHCCSGKALSIIYSDCMFVDSGIQHAMRLRHNVICGVTGSTIFST